MLLGSISAIHLIEVRSHVRSESYFEQLVSCGARPNSEHFGSISETLRDTSDMRFRQLVAGSRTKQKVVERAD